MNITPDHYPLLNRLAAEKVMGGRVYIPSFHPCESLADAATLTEKVCKANQWNMAVTLYWDGLWHCEMWTYGRDSHVTLNAPTEPLARTLAALAACGVDVEKELSK